MSLSKELQTLKEFHCDDRCVLSVYLNTNPGDPEQLNGGVENSFEEWFEAN